MKRYRKLYEDLGFWNLYDDIYIDIYRGETWLVWTAFFHDLLDLNREN